MKKTRKYLNQYMNGGNADNKDEDKIDWAGIAGSVLPALMSLTDKPLDYSKQPIVNMATARNMFDPYSGMKPTGFAFGGDETDNMDEDQMQQIQDQADSMGISVEDLMTMVDQYQGQDDNQEEDLLTEPIEGDEEDTDNTDEESYAMGGWIQKAVNPAHKGYCTPMTKSTCTPKRKALARTFKKHHGFHKAAMGGLIDGGKKGRKAVVQKPYGIYDGIMGNDNPTSDDALLNMMHYLMNNNSPLTTRPSNVYRPQFQHYSLDNDKPLTVAAYGGKTGKVPINVEGNELVESPNGNVAKVKGPKHEQGGVDINVPGGTKIFSDRLKVDGKSMQERKMARIRKMNKIGKITSNNPTDNLSKNTYNRMKQGIEMEEQQDMTLQNIANKLYAAPQEEQPHGYGGRVKYAYGAGPGPGDDDEYLDNGTGEVHTYKELKDYYNDQYLDGNIVGGKPLFKNIDDYMEGRFKSFPNKFSVNPKKANLFNIPMPTNTSTPGVPIKGLPTPKGMYTDKTGSHTPNLMDALTSTLAQPEAMSNTLAPRNSPNNPVIGTPTAGKTAIPNTNNNLTLGDWIGLGGNAFNAIAPIINTNNNAKATRPNINRFKGFGRNAIMANDHAQDYVAGALSNANTDVDINANTAFARNRNSARGVNTLRALDTTTQMAKDKAKATTSSNYSKQMMGILGQRSELENIKDKYEMTGQTRADAEDKMDIDNYFSNMAANLTNFGTNVQGIGKNLNTAHGNKVNANLLSQLSKYGLDLDKDGNLINGSTVNSYFGETPKKRTRKTKSASYFTI